MLENSHKEFFQSLATYYLLLLAVSTLKVQNLEVMLLERQLTDEIDLHNVIKAFVN